MENMFMKQIQQDIEVKPKNSSEIIEQPKQEIVEKPKQATQDSVSTSSFIYDESKSIDENASDLMELKASEQALKDEQFVDKVATIKKEQIENSAKTNKEIHIAKKEAEKINAITEIDSAFYEQWKTILNFGGIQEPTTKSFSIFMLFIITPFYIISTICISMPITIIRYLFAAINTLFEQIAKFGKIGRSIAFSILIIGLLALVAWIIISLLNRFGVIDISSFIAP